MRLVCLTLAVAVTAGHATAFELHADDYERVRGDYALADGRALAIVGTRRHPRVEFDDGRSQPLRALSATEFATADGCTRITFEAHANGNVTRVDVTRACGAR
jgi:hypothetical protein